MLRSFPSQTASLVLTYNSRGLSDPKWPKPLYGKGFTTCLKIAKAQPPLFDCIGNLSQWTFLRKPKALFGPTLPSQTNLWFSFLPSLVLTSPFALAELDYRNSYEIEHMEKIGSSLPVSSSASSQQGTCFPPCFGVSLVTRGWSRGRGLRFASVHFRCHFQGGDDGMLLDFLQNYFLWLRKRWSEVSLRRQKASGCF